MMNQFQHFGIIGAGAWGTALGATLIRAGRDVTLWSRGAPVARTINEQFENVNHLPGINLDPKLKAVTELAALAGCDAYILATPSQVLRDIARQLAPHAAAGAPMIVAAKGIELATSSLLSDAIKTALPGHPCAILSGPSFAAEVAKALPTALTLAAGDRVLCDALVAAMASPSFRLYCTDDLIGCQVGGALKNVLAIACGVITGRELGENARAALITRGLAEIIRLAVALGGRAETLMGQSGIGDLLLTCTSAQSRNMSLGIALGEGRQLADILALRTGVTEGVATAGAALRLARGVNVELPITAAVDAVLNRQADIDTIIRGLLARPLRTES